MKTWTEVRYKVERTRKEYAYELNGSTIMLKEVYNSKGQNIFCVAKIITKDKTTQEMHYDPKTRIQVIRELEDIALGKRLISINPMNGKGTYR